MQASKFKGPAFHISHKSTIYQMGRCNSPTPQCIWLLLAEAASLQASCSLMIQCGQMDQCRNNHDHVCDGLSSFILLLLILKYIKHIKNRILGQNGSHQIVLPAFFTIQSKLDFIQKYQLFLKNNIPLLPSVFIHFCTFHPSSNNYNSKQSLSYKLEHMKCQARSFPQQNPHKSKGPEQVQTTVNSKPIKCPSPDRLSSNSIKLTLSPLMQQVKKHITPIKEEPTASKILQKIENREKLISADVTPKNHKDSQPYQDVHRHSEAVSSFGQQKKYEDNVTIKQQNKSKHQEPSTSYKPPKNEDSPSEFEIRYSSRLKENYYQSKTGELDYLRLLKEKQETIKELRDLLELIEKSNSGEYEQDERVKLLQRKLKEYSKQVKVLEIQNQCLISVIENNHVNIPSNKEEILQREIRQLRESLSISEQMTADEIANFKKRVQQLQDQNNRLENECERLLKIMKQRQAEKKETPNYNPHPLLIKDKERTTLTKIREQYNQNLQLAKENFEAQYQDCYQSFVKVIEKEGRKLDYMSLRVQQLELALREKKPSSKNQPIETKEHQQIESLLFEKYSKYMKELDEEKKVNEKLNLELSIAWKSLRELQMKSFNSSQDIMNESQSEELSELSHRNTNLKNRIKELEAGNYVLKKTIEQVSELRLNDIRKFQEKLEVAISASEEKLKEQKQFYQQKCKQYELLELEMARKQQKQRLQQAQKQSLIQEKITEIIHTYEKQAEIYKDNLLQRARTIESLQEQNGILRNQIENYMNQKEKETDISKVSESQRMMENLENEVRQYKDRLADCNYFISKLEESNSGLERDNELLRKSIEEIRLHSHAELQKALNESRQQLQELSERVEANYHLKEQNQHLLIQNQQKAKEISALKEKINSIERQSHETSEYISQMKIFNVNAHNDESFEEQLKGLKKSIVQFFAKYKEQTGGKLLENYYTIETLYQGKIDQNLKLHEELESQKEQIIREQRQKLRLIEKISNLEKNISIYEHELKQRKVLYEGLLKQKSRIQKQGILTRKLKDSQNFDDSNSSNVNEITKQIDRLVETQRNRRKNIIKQLLQQKQLSL